MSKNIMKKQSIKKHLGMTFISWIVVLAFIGFKGLVLIKIMPVFADDQTVKSIWNSMENDPEMIGLSPKAIKKTILKKMKVNSMYNFDMNSVTIKRAKGYYVVRTEYEPRGTIIGPVDFIVSFEHEASIKIK